MKTSKPYIYAVLPDKVLRYWTGTGWTTDKRGARRFQTDAEAEGPLRRMMLDNIKAKVAKWEK